MNTYPQVTQRCMKDRLLVLIIERESGANERVLTSLILGEKIKAANDALANSDDLLLDGAGRFFLCRESSSAKMMNRALHSASLQGTVDRTRATPPLYRERLAYIYRLRFSAISLQREIIVGI